VNVPGLNLLTHALRQIHPQKLDLYRFVGSTTNAIGNQVRQYAEKVTVSGSVQAVERKFYSDMGLDFNRRYISIWTTTDVEDSEREKAGDQLRWNSNRWEVVGETEWFEMDGWNTVLAIEVSDQ
jgi:hypothetical protein